MCKLSGFPYKKLAKMEKTVTFVFKLTTKIAMDREKYIPQPIDTAGVCLPTEQEPVLEQLLRNMLNNYKN